MPLLGKKGISPLWITISLIIGGFLFFGTTLYLSQRKSLSQAQLEESTVVVTQENLRVKIRASGTVEPIASVNISPKNSGIVDQLLVEQGDKVEKGQILAIMDNKEEITQKDQAEANLEEAIANLEEFDSRVIEEVKQLTAQVEESQASLLQAESTIPTQIDQAKSQLEAAQARFELAQGRVTRNQYLLSEGAISEDEFDASTNEFKTAQASLLEARQKLLETENNQNPQIAQLKAQLQQAQSSLRQRQSTIPQERARLQSLVDSQRAQYQYYELLYQDTILKAPFAGIVTQRYATEGAFVTPTTSASTTIGATSTSVLALAQGLEIIAKISEIDLSTLFPGQMVEIYADAYPQKGFQGKVRLIAPEAIVEESVTSFEVRIEILTGEELLRSKMNVDVVFLGEDLENTVTVPTVAIVTQEGQTGVMLVDNSGQPVFQPVTLGLTLDNKTQILEGLQPGQRVFIDLPE